MSDVNVYLVTLMGGGRAGGSGGRAGGSGGRAGGSGG